MDRDSHAPSRPKRVVVAMSGGVDSSVAAAMLHHQGCEVIGITLRLWTPSPWNNGERYGGCCSPADIADAKRVCQSLGVPHYTFDMEEKFKEKVVDDFVSEYLEGRTPNPCVRCNSFIKFDVLLKYAVALEADALATGHYARIEPSQEGFLLRQAVDPAKDQSYFLYMLKQSHLSRVLFPIGGLVKSEVRALAERYRLANACKEDSMDVCFLEGRSYRDFLRERVPAEKLAAGDIRTRDGKLLGRHQGLPFYTIGQRGSLGVATGERVYVVEKDRETNTLVVGPEADNARSDCRLHTASWCGNMPGGPIQASVKIRYRHPGAIALVTPLSETEAQVRFREPQASVTPGQSAVFYAGDRVLGGGVIAD